ncbi:hypothetical protein JXR93_13290, partial [bacterium]|nr:hypothetical protein [bacterium]
KTGFLLDEIRLNGENKELVDEVIKIATKFNIVTPYTSYLVVEKNSEQTRRDPDPVFLENEDQSMIKRDQARTKSLILRGDSEKSVGSASPKMDSVGGSAFNEEESLADGEGFYGETGSKSVGVSKKIKDMKGSTTIDTKSSQKTIGAKTFVLSNGVWIDTASVNVKAKKTVTVKYLSSNYMKLLKNTALKRYLTLGENIDILFNGIKIEIRSETKESDIPSELLK